MSSKSVFIGVVRLWESQQEIRQWSKTRKDGTESSLALDERSKAGGSN
jgi:hypothetical protein